VLTLMLSGVSAKLTAFDWVLLMISVILTAIGVKLARSDRVLTIFD
jgi:hypothetical protein